MTLAVTITAEVAGKLVLNNGITSQLRPRRYYTIHRDTVEGLIGDVHELANFFVIEGQRILFAENIGVSAVVRLTPSWFPSSATSTDNNLGRPCCFRLVLPRQACSLLGSCHPRHYSGLLRSPRLRCQQRAH